jgi:hypothetical protein
VHEYDAADDQIVFTSAGRPPKDVAALKMEATRALTDAGD